VREVLTMRNMARATYVLTLLIMATLPFNPMLNKRFAVLPLALTCVAVGLVAMYICTFPDKPRSGRKGDIS
jgi:hypothetical protein